MFFVPKVYGFSEIEVKKSKFISYLFRFDEFKTNLEQLKLKHPKAVHFVWAYRYLNEFHQVVEDCTDDGEPKGSSGRPTLKVLQGNNLINTAIITVRYFGGIKLGVGGLVRAYSESANECIRVCEKDEFVELETTTLDVLYSNLSKVEYLAKKYEVDTFNKQFLIDKVKLHLRAKKENLKAFIQAI